MKRTLTAIILASMIGNAQAMSGIKMNPVYRPINPAQYSYNAGYNNGYTHGRNDHRDKVFKTVGVTILVVGGALLLYEAIKPSENIEGQVQLVRF